MGIVSGQYRYIDDLHGLEGNQAYTPFPHFIRGPTPVIVSALLPFMHQHPDQQFARYIWNGLCHGFHIGFDRHRPLRQNWRNHPSSLENPSVVQMHIQTDLRRGSLVGPLPPGQAEQVHVSPLGLVPKPHSDSWRLIVDLSAPRGFSVNDGIRADLCSLMYASVDNAVDIIQHLGQGTQLVKVDLKDAY